MSKNTAFVERLKRAEHNAATRQKRRGAATHTTHAAVPSKAFMENSPFHQRRARLEEWFANDAYISPAALFRGPLESEVNAQLLKDLHAVKNDLLGGKLLRLLLGPEAAGGDLAEDSINVFGTSSQHEAPAAGPYAHSPDLRSSSPSAVAVVGSSPEERELPEYEAKLHRYSTKTRVEIMERLRRPTGEILICIQMIKQYFLSYHLPFFMFRCAPGEGTVPDGSDGRVCPLAWESRSGHTRYS